MGEAFRDRRNFGAGQALAVLGLLAFALIVVIPLLWILVGSPRASRDTLTLALPQGRGLVLLLRSIGLAALVAGLATLSGGFAALRMATMRRGVPSAAVWLILILLVMPSYVHALAWSTAADALSALLEPLLGFRLRFSGMWASAWVQGMSLLPAAVGLALLGLFSVDADLLSAAWLLRSDGACLARILVPLAAPYWLAGTGLLFCLSFLDYGIPALFETNVYALEVLAEYSASAQPSRALYAALPMVGLAAIVVAACQKPLRRAFLHRAWRSSVWQVAPSWPRWLSVAQQTAMAMLLLHLAVPLVVLLAVLGDGGSLVASISAAGADIAYSLSIAALSALGCLPLGLAAARGLAGRGWLAALWWVLVIMQLAVPGSLVGIGQIAFWGRWSPRLVYGSAAMPVLAHVARFAPWAALVVLAQLRRLDPALWDAARLMPVPPWQRLTRVQLPLMAPGLLASVGLVAALSIGETAAALLTVPPGRETVSLRVFNYLHYGASSTVAALCLAMVATAAAGGVLAALALSHWARRAGL